VRRAAQFHGDGTCEVQLGQTRALAVVTAELVRARPLRRLWHTRMRVRCSRRRCAALRACVRAQTKPYPDRPSEGVFAVSVELGPMASPEFEAGRPSEAAVELARVLERGLKQSGALA
jgi:exosome complex RNA-binding protein Rrp42 (RNase PH superfamily)